MTENFRHSKKMVAFLEKLLANVNYNRPTM